MAEIEKTEKKSMSVRDMAFIAMFAAIIAACAWITVPTVVPFTMQTFGIFCAVGILGGKRGTMSAIVYVLLGAVGVPVFAGFSGGLSALLSPSGGYIIGFVGTAFVYWLIRNLIGDKLPEIAVQIIAMSAGLLVCYAFGTAWFMIVYAQSKGAIGLLTALGWCIFPFIIPDAIKIGMAILISKVMSKYVKL